VIYSRAVEKLWAFAEVPGKRFLSLGIGIGAAGDHHEQLSVCLSENKVPQEETRVRSQQSPDGVVLGSQL
jgi:hypothetical protein